MDKKVMPLLPLRDIVVFPYMVVPLFVGRQKSINALDDAVQKGREILLATQRSAKTDDPKPEDIHKMGTIATVLQLLRLPDGTIKALVEGKRRGKVAKFLPSEPHFLIEVEEVFDAVQPGTDTEALIRGVLTAFENYHKLNRKLSPEMLQSVSSITEPGRLADTLAAHMTLKIENKQKVLDLEDPTERLEHVLGLLQAELEILQAERRIRARVKKQMEKTQKEYYLTEQLKAIQKELGQKDEFHVEIEELEEKSKKKKLSKEGREKVDKEIKKLKMMSPMSAEATVVRNYVDWIISLPWEEYADEKLDIQEAEKILDEDHYGLNKVKERILEYLAVQNLVKKQTGSPKMKGPILCLVGPPGVGKTSLAKSIARSTGRKFVKISLGGVRDEAEIRGHRRTYIGALPGKVVQGMKKAGQSNPVFLLDEIDKMSMDFRGDPSAALMEVLDPEQNNAFSDHYLDLDYDLSRVMFITTANILHGIPVPLQDRLEVLRMPGYTEDEKLHIAKQFLIPKQRKENGLKEENIEITNGGTLAVIRKYTREAGVRNLEREIATLCRKVAKEVMKKKDDSVKIVVSGSSIPKYLGVARFKLTMTEDENQIGICNGLAWTEFGGELLTTEVTTMPGKGKLIITGKLGEVMQESAQAAMSYVRSRAGRLGLDKEFYQKLDIHVHVPEGAVPKDGPSAGVTMATSIVSALTRRVIRKDVAMTGEITLRGRVLPIGGLKEKLLAAHRAQIKKVIVPKENEKDLKDIPTNITKAFELVLVDNMDQVLEHAIVIGAEEKLFVEEKEFPKEKEKIILPRLAKKQPKLPEKEITAH
ncbi:MAG: endopeptidase La [Nitrospirae bacterium]|nr:endopeptidase La [Nitrospirota bacterium]